MTARSTPRLPAAPLVAELERAARRRGVAIKTLLVDPERFRAFRDARWSGVIELELAEDFCEQILGWHTRMIYGELWDRATDQAAGHTLTRYREGTRSAYNHGCRCSACCRANATYVAERRRASRRAPTGGEAA